MFAGMVTAVRGLSLSAIAENLAQNQHVVLNAGFCSRDHIAGFGTSSHHQLVFSV